MRNEQTVKWHIWMDRIYEERTNSKMAYLGGDGVFAWNRIYDGQMDRQTQEPTKTMHYILGVTHGQ